MSRLRPQDAETRAQRANSADFSEALARGLRVINAFDEQQRQMTLSDIARVIDLPRATTRRALTTLVELGYVESEGRLFRLTPRILRLRSTRRALSARDSCHLLGVPRVSLSPATGRGLG